MEWTGTWRDPRSAPGRRPAENSLTGQLFIVNSGSADLKVPAEYKNLRLWRNTAVANLGAGQTRTLAPGGQTLGYEWDVDVDNGFRPRGPFKLSSTTVSGIESFTDYGSTVELGTTQTHNLTMYRAPSGALVFGAGTVQWAWGLDTTNAWANNGPPARPPDPVMQQATVNLFADMGAQPSSLMSGLSPASRSTDTTAPELDHQQPVAGGGDRGRDAVHDLRHGHGHGGGASPAWRSPPTTARPGTRPPARRRGPTRGSCTARRARRSGRARSMTPATSSRRAERQRQRRLPVHAARART